jgi:hypothetical protein
MFDKTDNLSLRKKIAKEENENLCYFEKEKLKLDKTFSHRSRNNSKSKNLDPDFLKSLNSFKTMNEQTRYFTFEKSGRFERNHQNGLKVKYMKRKNVKNPEFILSKENQEDTKKLNSISRKLQMKTVQLTRKGKINKYYFGW